MTQRALIFDENQIAFFSSGEQWWRDLNRAQEADAAMLMTNNLQVAFLAFAGGMTAALLTTCVTIFNGLMLGAVFGMLRTTGTPWPLAEFVAGFAAARACDHLSYFAPGSPGLASLARALVD
jgi:hypothetical protein